MFIEFVDNNEMTPVKRQWCVALIEENMKTLYQQSCLGWNLRAKLKEMNSPSSKFIFLGPAANPIGFCHYQFTREEDVEGNFFDALYWYSVR